METDEGGTKWWSKAGIDPGKYVGRDPSAAEAKARSGFVAKAKRNLGKIPKAREVVALYFCLIDPATPAWVKAIVAAALAYFILPIDAIPDILPIIGLSDDLSLLAAAYASVAVFITPEHLEKARAWIDHEQPGHA
jgi:uncharacterized membrane protein YkvA (DUF1232 family)